MLKSYIVTALRNLRHNKWHVYINIGGLAVGLASFTVILLYLNYELSYDKWAPSLKQVYKVSMREHEDILPMTPAPMASFLAQHAPGVESATSVMPAGDYEALIANGRQKIYQRGLVTTDSTFLKVFPYTLVRGDAATALNQPNAIILSEEVSRKLFGNADPMGAPVKLFNQIDAVVTGILKEPETPSHLMVKMVMRDPAGRQNIFWQNYSFQTYIKLRHPMAAGPRDEQINRVFYDGHLKNDNQTFRQYEKAGPATTLFSDAVADIHNFPRHGESQFTITIVLLVLAVFILIAGAINFSNLALARAMTRAKEVGVRKVLGSGRIQIITQSLLEIAVQCVISLSLALLLVKMVLPYFSSQFNLPVNFFQRGQFLSLGAQLSVCLVMIILVAGVYPAVFLSGFRTAEVLKGKYTRGTGGRLFRNGLLVVQLSLSVLFITGVIVVNRQVSYMQHQYLGFEPSRVMRIEATQKTRDTDFPQVRNKLLSIPGVEYVAKSTTVAGDWRNDTTTREFRCDGKKFRLNSSKVSADYFSVMNIQLLQGRLFSDLHPEDPGHSAIINETALHKLGVANPTGKLIYFSGCDTIPYTIVGVVKNFHVQGFQHAVEPSIYTISNNACEFRSGGAILVRVSTDHVQQTLAGMQAAWKNIEPDFPIRYSFLDQDFQQLFTEYIRLERVIFFFSIISLIITGVGLFALTSFLCRQRVKEVGIRKVLGASVTGVAALLSRDFLKILAISIVIALPIAGWALNKWLEGFAYRISMSWWIFAMAGLITIGLTLLTVCIQALRAAGANPVKSLRTE